ncbi:MAG: HpcH/HpaI aldolase/citrate lyase family protein [Gammaproteobacteria bacterium]|jgi:citrate lyase subunit beta/citryl-CoA lyase
MIPRRSVLYLPGANTRALDKARTLPCDSLILDLEDAVAPSNKGAARANVAAAVRAGGFGYRELIVRVNGLDTPWGHDDLRAVADLELAAVLFPKVDSAAAVPTLIEALDAAGGQALPLWLMIESPASILNVAAIACASPRIAALVAGTSDLVQALRARHTATRHNLAFALQQCVTAARAAGIDVLDGVHLDFRNAESLRQACAAARDMGFDGKTLIHPSQIDIANECFAPDPEAVAHAERVLETWQAALADGRGVAELDGQLIENLHAVEAERTLAYTRALDAREV